MWGEAPEGKPPPDSWDSERQPSDSKDGGEMRRGIQALNRKIDELSEMYNRKLHTGKAPEEIQVNNVIPEATGAPTNPDPAMTQMWERMLRPFLEAQWNFYSSYDYGKSPHPPMGTQGMQYEKWGSRFRKESFPGRGGWTDNVNRVQPEQRNWYNRSGTPDNFRNRFQDARFDNFRASQPKKRLRFSQWLQSDKARGSGSGSETPRGDPGHSTSSNNGNRTPTLPNGIPMDGQRGDTMDNQRMGKGGTKRSQPGDPKETLDRNREKSEDMHPPEQPHQNMFSNITSRQSN